MIRHLTGGGWGMVIRRILGAAMRTVPLLAVLFIPIILGDARSSTSGRSRSIRSRTSTSASISKTSPRRYLTTNGFIIRAIIYFAIWNLLSFLLSHWSKQTDRAGAPDNTERFKAVAGPGLILYGFTISFAAIDWVMSLDPSWISTIFGLIILIGEVLSAMCFAVVVERILFNYKPMSEMLTPDFVHDHGKWMLAFTMVWAYFNFSQWLIIWAGNLPAEITYYIRRINGGWGYVGLFVVIFHFAVPFAILLSRPFKRNISQTGLAGCVADVDALRGSVLDHRTEFLEDFQRNRGRHCRAHRHRRILARLLLPQPGRAAAAAGLRPVSRRGFASGASSPGKRVTDEI